jgi:tRNA (guanine37-N1)-methyltransferase
MFDSFLSYSMIKRAIDKKRVRIDIRDLRDFTHDRHRTCDDKPFGGGPGMLMKPEPIFEAVRGLGAGATAKKKGTRFIYLSPQGAPFKQATAESLASAKELIFLCGHYEGVDQRVIDRFVTDEISIGDYVLTQGELPAMVVMDSVIRLLKGVVGNEASKEFESFSHNLLEYPQYTRPAVYRGLKVPEVLLSGDHKKIEEWRERAAYEKTLDRRPDLLRGKLKNFRGKRKT